MSVDEGQCIVCLLEQIQDSGLELTTVLFIEKSKGLTLISLICFLAEMLDSAPIAVLLMRSYSERQLA